MSGCDWDVSASFTSSCFVCRVTSCQKLAKPVAASYVEPASEMISFEANFSTLLWAPYQFVSGILEDRGERKSETSHSAVFGWNSNRERISGKRGPWQMVIFMYFFLLGSSRVRRSSKVWSGRLPSQLMISLHSHPCSASFFFLTAMCCTINNSFGWRTILTSAMRFQRSTFRRQSDTSSHALSVMDQTEFLAVSQPSSSVETVMQKRPLLPTMVFWSTRGP